MNTRYDCNGDGNCKNCLADEISECPFIKVEGSGEGSEGCNFERGKRFSGDSI
jgi:hypothetical protein